VKSTLQFSSPFEPPWESCSMAGAFMAVVRAVQLPRGSNPPSGNVIVS
jgi:hypothetical protein